MFSFTNAASLMLSPARPTSRSSGPNSFSSQALCYKHFAPTGAKRRSPVECGTQSDGRQETDILSKRSLSNVRVLWQRKGVQGITEFLELR
jgi:hypothetical protein